MIAGVQRSADETLIEYGVREGAAAIRRGVMTSTEHVEACLARIAATDDRLQAWITVDGARRIVGGDLGEPNECPISGQIDRSEDCRPSRSERGRDADCRRRPRPSSDDRGPSAF